MDNKTLEQNLIETIFAEALDFLAAKAGVTSVEIKSAIEADPDGNVAKRFTELAFSGIKNIDAIIESARTGKRIANLA